MDSPKTPFGRSLPRTTPSPLLWRGLSLHGGPGRRICAIYQFCFLVVLLQCAHIDSFGAGQKKCFFGLAEDRSLAHPLVPYMWCRSVPTYSVQELATRNVSVSWPCPGSTRNLTHVRLAFRGSGAKSPMELWLGEAGVGPITTLRRGFDVRALCTLLLA